MRSRKAMLRVLLDTSFILPSLGIDVGEQVFKALKRLVEIEAEIYYSHFSILEALWVAARLAAVSSFDPESFSLGLRSIVEGDRYVKTKEDSETFSGALRLYMLGHRDMVDNVLYSDSVRLDLKLLTLDNELESFIHEKGLRDTFLLPHEIV